MQETNQHKDIGLAKSKQMKNNFLERTKVLNIEKFKITPRFKSGV